RTMTSMMVTNIMQTRAVPASARSMRARASRILWMTEIMQFSIQAGVVYKTRARNDECAVRRKQQIRTPCAHETRMRLQTGCYKPSVAHPAPELPDAPLHDEAGWYRLVRISLPRAIPGSSPS